MTKLPIEREGVNLVAKGVEIEFSFWPLKKTTSRYGLQNQIYSSDPWSVIENCINTKCKKHNEKTKAAILSYIEQSLDFYNAAGASKVVASKPVLIYYCLLNLVKAFILYKKIRDNLDDAYHGIRELDNKGKNIGDHELEVFPSSNRSINVFYEFAKSIGVHSICKSTFTVFDIMDQIVFGHRMWVAANNRNERFVAAEKIYFREDKSKNLLWLSIAVKKESINNINSSQAGFLSETRLSDRLRQVKPRNEKENYGLVIYEQIIPTTYSNRPTDSLCELILAIKNNLWAVLLSAPPYRKYYLYLNHNQDIVIPQLLSFYMIIFYFGSITRYRPLEFDCWMKSQYGAQVREIINVQPLQFIYLLGGEFLQNNLVKPAVI